MKLTKANLISWLSAQSPKKSFDYFADDCLVARYLTAQGHREVLVTGLTYSHSGKPIKDIPRGIADSLASLVGHMPYLEAFTRGRKITYKRALKALAA